MSSLVLLALGALGLALDLHWLLRAALTLPSLLLAPGLGWSRWLNQGQRSVFVVGLDAAWLSLLTLIPGVLLASTAQGNPWLLLLNAALWSAPGLWLGWNASPIARTRLRTNVGLAILLLCVGSWAGLRLEGLSRPLQDWWYSAEVDSLQEQPVPWQAAQGWESTTAIGWPEAGAAELSDPQGDGGSLEIQGSGRILLLLQGPQDSSIKVRQSGAWSATERVQLSPEVDPEEGPVARYLDYGITALATEVSPGTLQIKVQSSAPVRVFVLPGSAAPWSLDEAGALRYAHYYQLLNLVENQVWADELLHGERRLTIHQPPLWSYVLASSAAVSPDMPGAAALLLWVLLLLGASALRLIELLSPQAPWPAWALPAVFVMIHGELLLQPGSVNFPDSLYAAAIVAGMAALADRSTARFVLLALIAGLLRYPGVVVLVMAAGLHRWLGLLPVGTAGRAGSGRALRSRLKALALTAAALLAVAAIAAGISAQLREWLFILYFETVPEHFSNNTQAPPIWARPPQFYWTWLRYTGFGLLAALPLSTKGSRWVLCTALLYSLMLAGIDHSPSHYFLPLLALSGVAIATNSAGMPTRPLRWGLSISALTLGLVFVLRGAA